MTLPTCLAVEIQRNLPRSLILFGLAVFPVTGSVSADDDAPPQDAKKPQIADRITVFGKVLDAKTGEPVKSFVVQGGRFGFDKKNPKRHEWGFSERRSTRGRYQTTIQWNKGWTARIVADGYEPHPVLLKAPPPGKKRLEIDIRLKPGRVVRGIVLDHKGNPVEEAAVFAVSRRGLNLVGKKAVNSVEEEDKAALRVLTGKDGRFEIPIGEAEFLGIATDFLECWQAPIPDGTKPDNVIQLPQPGTLSIRYNIEGASKDDRIFYQLLPTETETFHRLHTSRNLDIPNGEGLILRNMPPATYQIARYRMVKMKHMGFGQFLDRKKITIESGKTTTIRFIRPNGARVNGTVLGLNDTGAEGAMIKVHPEPKPGDPTGVAALFSRPNFDSRLTDAAGNFTTEKLEPGTYEVRAEVYLPLEGDARFSTGFPTPRYVGSARLVVPQMGEASRVKIELKGTQQKQANEKPATR